MLSRKLLSVSATVALGGGLLMASAVSIPLAQAAEVTEAPAAQTSPENAEQELFSYDSLYILQGDSEVYTPLSGDLPAGTALALDEGPALEELRADGWVIAAEGTILTVKAPRHAEGYYEIPVIVTFPDQSTRATSVTMSVDYRADIPLSIWVPVAAYVHSSENSTSSLSSMSS